jgi:hypothetical protein
MSLLGQVKMYLRFVSGLRGFLKEPITLQKSREIIKQRLENREQNLLNIVKRAIYGNEHSPYLKLLKVVGCDYGDFEKMVCAEGIEPALRTLSEEGVYLSIDEFKGRQAVIRGRKVFKFRESDYDNPFLLHHLEARTGGSSGAGSRTFWDFDHIALGRAAYTICLLDAYEALTAPMVIWASILPGWGQRVVLEHAKVGKPVAKWFSPVSENRIRPSLKNRLVAKYITYMGRLWGSKLPVPEYVPLDEAWRVAQWIEDAINRRKECYLHTDVSNAVRICQAARNKGLDLTGAKFALSSEPITKVKRQEIESAGVHVCPRYDSIEVGTIGFGCLHPKAPDDIHFFKDSLALIQRQIKAHNEGLSVDAFLFTSLILSAPKVLFNVDLGDYGLVETRHCGCYFNELGFDDHVYNIRSYDKLTSQGMTFHGIDLIMILEEVLPVKYGGTSIDYQMVEEEDKDGHTQISVIVSPTVGEIDEPDLAKTVLAELSKGKDTQRMMAEVWSQSKTIRVKRMLPITTARGKLMPLHVQKAK